MVHSFFKIDIKKPTLKAKCGTTETTLSIDHTVEANPKSIVWDWWKPPLKVIVHSLIKTVIKKPTLKAKSQTAETTQSIDHTVEANPKRNVLDHTSKWQFNS